MRTSNINQGHLLLSVLLGGLLMFGITEVPAQVPMLPDDQAAQLARLRAKAMTVAPQERRGQSEIQRSAPGTRVCQMNIGTQDASGSGPRSVLRRENVTIVDAAPILVCQ